MKINIDIVRNTRYKGNIVLSALAIVGCETSESALSDAMPDQIGDGAAVTGKFTPPGDGTLVIIGQTSDGIRYYLDNAGNKPYGVTIYTNPILDGDGWSLPGGGTASQSATYRDDYGPQSLTYLQQEPQLGDRAVAVGLYIGFAYETDVAYGENRMRDVVYPQGVIYSGAQMRENLSHMITDLKALNRPVFLRIGYEAEGYWNGHWPDAYKLVWRAVKDEITAHNATNIATVWQLAAYCESSVGPIRNPGPLVASDPIDKYSNEKRVVSPGDYEDWYPGDDVVDWTAISIFTQGYDCDTGSKQGYQVMQEVVDYLKQKGKPIMVAESAPKGYDLANGVFEQVGLPRRTGLSGQAMWDEWFQPYFDFIEVNKKFIRAIAYINDDWEQYNHWQCTTDDNGNIVSGCVEDAWNNSRLDANPTIQSNWNAVITGGGYVLDPMDRDTAR
ncbi:MAG: hypothetical protein MJE77_45270 [Proteobacteria bacterium]|nr:hypothetical protein [Pseudomonadota bacterium]